MSIPSRNNSPRGRSSDESGDDFVMLNEPQDFVIRTNQARTEQTLRLDLNPIKPNHSFLLSIHPPAKPIDDIKHVGCDIVLVIDVSGSMATRAPLPGAESQQEREASNLTVLDLVRHACRTIVTTLNAGDRLALITFSRDAKVVQSLTHMTAEAKAQTLEKVEKLKDEGATNLWAGIKAGVKEIVKHADTCNVQGIFVLTDGQPNLMCPQQGYVRKLKPLLDDLSSIPTIQTFGFGYDIRSDLMLSIAKLGNGNYAFIPDVGMIGTVFVHAVANLYATYATNVSVQLSVPASSIHLDHNSGLPCERPNLDSLLIKLGNIQYGQSRDLVIFYSRAHGDSKVLAEVAYTPYQQASQRTTARFSASQPTRMPQLLLDYHYHRNSLCEFLSEFYPINPLNEQHMTALASNIDSSLMGVFKHLVAQLTQGAGYRSDPNLSSLLSDLVGPRLNPKTPEAGQIYQALQTSQKKTTTTITKSPAPESYWQKWGRHYLSSLWCAHMRQNCNTFKDAGPLRYGTDSELFKRCRDELDQAFDDLPPPKGTLQTLNTYNSYGHVHGNPGMNYIPVSMSRYNRAENGCFAGSCPVTLADGTCTTVEELRVGMSIHNDVTGTVRRITGIVKTVITGTGGHPSICRIGKNLWITPYHPIFNASSKTWVFPHTVAEEARSLHDREAVYSIQLEPSPCADDHAVIVGGVACVTLGHGLVGANGDGDVGDARAHPFFGDYVRVEECLRSLRVDGEGRRVSSGLIKDSVTGLTCGFAAVDEVVVGVDSGIVKNVNVSVAGLGMVSA